MAGGGPGEEGDDLVRPPAVVPFVDVLHGDVAVFLDEGGRCPAGGVDAFDSFGCAERGGVVDGEVCGGHCGDEGEKDR